MANNSKFASVNRFAVLASPKGSPKGSPKIKPVITIKTDSGVSNTTSERSADSPPPLLAPIPVVATPPRLGTPYNYAKAAMKNLSPQSAGQKIHFRTKVEEIDEIESPVAADFSEFWDGLAKKAQRDINEQRITERARILLPSDEDIIRAFLPEPPTGTSLKDQADLRQSIRLAYASLQGILHTSVTRRLDVIMNPETHDNYLQLTDEDKHRLRHEIKDQIELMRGLHFFINEGIRISNMSVMQLDSWEEEKNASLWYTPTTTEKYRHPHRSHGYKYNVGPKGYQKRK